MDAPATFSANPAVTSPYGVPSGLGELHVRLDPEFRIGGPPKSLRRGRLLKTAVVAALATAGLAAYAHPDVVGRWSKRIRDEIRSYIALNEPSPGGADAPLPALHLLDTSAGSSGLPETAVATDPAAETSKNEAAEEEEAAAAPVERLPPPVIDPTDPYQARALAIGLHPGLSRALLTRLSAIDFDNAARAIKTALAETPDTDVLIWPRQRSPELAQFKVKFATSAAPKCRRYVVEIGKDGWMTTALPMEKCGIPKPRQASASIGGSTRVTDKPNQR